MIFDLGGVVLGSPLHAIAAYERDAGIQAGFVNRLVVESGSSGAWSRLERGELSLEAFCEAFDRESAAAGQPVSARALMERIGESSGPEPLMLEAIQRLRIAGLRVSALTGRGLKRIWATAEKLEQAASLKIPTAELNRWLQDCVRKHEPAMAQRGSCSDQERQMFFDEGARLMDRGAEAVILAGTDLFLAFEGQDPGYPVIDGGRLHIAEIARLAAGSG